MPLLGAAFLPRGPGCLLGRGPIAPEPRRGAMGGSYVLPQEHKPYSVAMRCPNPSKEGLSTASAVLQTSRK